MKAFFLLLSWIFFLPIHGEEKWMQRRIEKDLAPFEQGVCEKCLIGYFTATQAHHNLLMLVRIKNNRLQISRSKDLPEGHDRFQVIRASLHALTKSYSLPDTTFLISLGDTCDVDKVPIFAMCKHKESKNILFPDFEALAQRYQVIPDLDLTQDYYPVQWRHRTDKMIWRGSGAQGEINPQNMHEKSRVILCQLSTLYPDLIDAGFTFCIPQCISHLLKEKLSYEEIFNHRYQIWIDGNATSYGNSGWRFFSGSTVFKEDSDYEQWYFDELWPDLHYIAVKKGLTNLLEKLVEMQWNPIWGELIASEGNHFIRTHLNLKSCHEYFYKLLCSYADLHKKKGCFPSH